MGPQIYRIFSRLQFVGLYHSIGAPVIITKMDHIQLSVIIKYTFESKMHEVRVYKLHTVSTIFKNFSSKVLYLGWQRIPSLPLVQNNKINILSQKLSTQRTYYPSMNFCHLYSIKSDSDKMKIGVVLLLLEQEQKTINVTDFFFKLEYLFPQCQYFLKLASHR